MFRIKIFSQLKYQFQIAVLKVLKVVWFLTVLTPSQMKFLDCKPHWRNPLDHLSQSFCLQPQNTHTHTPYTIWSVCLASNHLCGYNFQISISVPLNGEFKSQAENTLQTNPTHCIGQPQTTWRAFKDHICRNCTIEHKGNHGVLSWGGLKRYLVPPPPSPLNLKTRKASNLHWFRNKKCFKEINHGTPVSPDTFQPSGI